MCYRKSFSNTHMTGTGLVGNFETSSYSFFIHHYGDVIMCAMASQITSSAIVYATVYSGADQRKHQSSASLAFDFWKYCLQYVFVKSSNCSRCSDSKALRKRIYDKKESCLQNVCILISSHKIWRLFFTTSKTPAQCLQIAHVELFKHVQKSSSKCLHLDFKLCDLKAFTRCVWDLWKYCLQNVFMTHSNGSRENVL